MPDVDLEPDAEAIAIKHLRSEGVTEARVHGEMPADPTFPLTTLFRVGGIASVGPRLFRASIQVDVWAEKGQKPQARLDAAKARQSLMRMAGQTISVTHQGEEVGGFVTEVRDVIGATWLPDPDTGRARYMFQVAVRLHR